MKKYLLSRTPLGNPFKAQFLFLLMLFSSVGVWGQGTLGTPIFSENFGTITDGTAITTSNTNFSYVRVGTSTGSGFNRIITKNPSSFTASSGLISAKGGSISTVDKTGLTSFSSGTFTFKFKTPGDLTSAGMLSGVGAGASFGSANGFTGAQLSAALQVTGTNLQIRAASGWTTVQTVAVSTAYTVAIVFNNTAASMNYGDSKTLPANKCHIWIDGVYSGEYSAATASLAASAFRIYTTTAEFEVDDIGVYNTLPASSGFTVSFDKNAVDANGTMSNQTASVANNITANAFSRTGYTFANWHTTTSGNGGTSYIDSQSYDFLADMTLYAQWTIKQYNVNYDGNGNDGGTAPITQTADYNTGITLATNSGTLTKTGFVFSGWNTNATGTGTNYAAGASFTLPAANTPLFAKWVSSSPFITTAGTLAGVNTTYGSPSANTSLTVSAGNLTNNLVITPPTGFEISTAAGSGFTTSLDLGITGRTNTTIFVRLAATTAVGTYAGNINLASGAISTTVATVNSTVSAKILTITGLSAANKEYDRTTSVIVTGTPAYIGLENSETFAVTGSVTWAFNNANVGTGKPITRTGNFNAPSANYTVTQLALMANITKKTLTVTGATAQNKPYDGTTAATITGTTLVGVISGDNVTASGGGTFATANVGTGIVVTPSLTLGGADNSNYSITQPADLSANITAILPAINTTTINLNVAGTYTLPGANVTSNSTGALSYSITSGGTSTLSGITITGVSAGTETLTVNQAADGNYTAGIKTVSVVVSLVTHSANDYRSTGGGTWSTQNAGTSTWEKWSTITNQWEPSSKPSANTSNVFIRHTITSNGATTVASVIVEGPNATEVTPGGNYTISHPSTINTKLLIENAGEMEIQAALTNNGIFEVENNGSVNINYATASGTAAIWNGIENFHSGSFVNIKNWNYGASAAIKSIIQNPTVIDSNSDGYYFGNLTISGNLTGTLPLVSGNQTAKLCQNDFTRNATGSNVFFTSSAGNITVGGNVLVSSGQISFAATTNGDPVINILGNLTANGGNINLNQNSSTAKVNVNLTGDLYVEKTNYFISSNENSIFNFAGSGNGSSDELTQTINVINQTTASNIKFNVNVGAYAKLINQNFVLGGSSSFTVKDGGTLDFGFIGTTALNMTNSVNSAVFTTEANSTLKITSPAGITTAVGSGNVQTMTTGRTFNPGATYHYVGKANQATGNGLVSGITGKVIVDLQTTDTNNENLDFTSTGTNTFGTTGGVNGVLEIRRGRVIDAPNAGFRNYNGTVDENNDGEADPQKGDVVMTGGRYVVSGGGTKPSLSGEYVLGEGTTVEFAGTSTSTKIRIKPSYYNVDVSGTNVETGGKNLIVNNLLRITNATAVLKVPLAVDTATPYVVTAKKGVEVAEDGQAIFANNAQLMQDISASNTGDIKMQRNVTIPVSTFNQYVYWSSPVSGQNYTTIFGVTTTAQYYIESNNLFGASLGTYILGRGLAVKNPVKEATAPSTLVAEFKGTPYVGDYDYPLAWSNAAHGYNLVGNPYPSNLDLNELYTSSSNIESTFRFWDNYANSISAQQGSNYNGYAYAKYNADSKAGVKAIGSAGNGNGDPASLAGLKEPNYILKVGQGFIARATALNAKLGFKNDKRISVQTAAEFFGKNKVDSTDNRYWLEMVTPKNLLVSNAIVYFDDGTNEFSADDSKLEGQGSDALFTNAGDEKVVINGRRTFADTDVVKVGNRYFMAGIYEIRLGKKDGIFENGQNIYLKDKLTGLLINLSAGSYSFSADAGEETGRFEIIYKPEAVLATGDITKDQLQVYRNGEDFIVRSGRKIIDLVEVFDISGRLVQKVKGGGVQVKINAISLVNGLYVLKINRNNEVTSKKMIK